ncbi:hypothetical protein E6W39_10285 [Kitasatospora acidiphila]|uniref:Uncharacterized protein n=1 Tax=Kitasatospora acidiphila TaxID=2567942 RepID=A0A540W0M9_9ACTN|nr:hypothetical protein [Kitasatospora acidiphila]TQF02579.1 hypothetical protein E6W39_10285 [Kitasatospora acidiphila]
MSTQVQSPQDGHAAPESVPESVRESNAGPDHRWLDLIALMSILAVCTSVCLLAGTEALQAVIGAAGILFAAWRTPRRLGQGHNRGRR